MAKRSTHYVYVEGEIWRLTSRQYIQYLAANVHRFAPVSGYGTYVGSGINVGRYDVSDFKEALRAARAERDKAVPK